MTHARSLLLANLGSPASTAEEHVRDFLDEFLMDPRILDMPYPLRWLIVKRMILPKRPAQSAHAYRSIWWEEGSPLIVLSERVRAKLAARLAMPVAMGMRYGEPSLQAGLETLLATLRPDGEVVLFPMYPHYAMSTYETLVLKTLTEMEKLVGAPVTPDSRAQRWLREQVIQANGRAFSHQVGAYTLTVIPPHYDHPDYVAALVDSARPVLADNTFDHLLFSYHGIPERHLHKTAPKGSGCLRDGCCINARAAHALCYRHQVMATSHAFARAAGLTPGRYSVSFQSRLGRDAWLQPYTAHELVRLARAGVKRLAVITPSFTVDCLETLEEIGIGGREIFMEAGGEDFQRIACLNDDDGWIDTMVRLLNTMTAPA